jgi:hypothetical protein
MENSANNYVNSLSKKFTKFKRKEFFFNEDNLIQKIFGGSLISTVKCSKCKTCYDKIDNFLDISLVKFKFNIGCLQF